MKLRIRGNSLRLRLLRGEVDLFGKTGRVIETIRFGASSGEKLIYALESDKDAREITARFTGSQIVVVVPEAAARSWVETEQISLKGEQSVETAAPEKILKILIEKDFVCLDRKEDPDNIDAFPHPNGKGV